MSCKVRISDKSYDLHCLTTAKVQPLVSIYAYDAQENAADGVFNALNQLLQKGDPVYLVIS